MINYDTYPCSRCGTPSVGLFVETTGAYTYYCNKHWYARNIVQEREFQRQEYELYKDKQWYQNLFPEKFNNDMESQLEQLYNRKKQKKQMKLL